MATMLMTSTCSLTESQALAKWFQILEPDKYNRAEDKAQLNQSSQFIVYLGSVVSADGGAELDVSRHINNTKCNNFNVNIKMRSVRLDQVRHFSPLQASSGWSRESFKSVFDVPVAAHQLNFHNQGAAFIALTIISHNLLPQRATGHAAHRTNNTTTLR